MNTVLYKDKLFTFTTDDLYIANEPSSDSIRIFLDVSKYFSLKYTQSKNLAKQRNKKYVFLGTFSTDFLNLNIIEKLNAKYAPLSAVSFDFQTLPGTPIIPADYTTEDSAYNFALTGCKTITTNSRVNRNIKKQYKHALKRLNRSMRMNDFLTSILFTQQNENKFRKAQCRHKAHRVYQIAYKRLVPFDSIYSMKVINRPLNLVAKLLCEFISVYTNDNDCDMAYALGELEKWEDCKKKYNLIRTVYALVSMHQFSMAYYTLCNFLLKHTNEQFEESYNSQYWERSFELKQSTRKFYNKQFDSFIYSLSKYTYNDIRKIDAYIDKFSSDNNPSPDKSNFYDMIRYNILSSNNNNHQLSLSKNILPNTQFIVRKLIGEYANLYAATNNNGPHTYLFSDRLNSDCFVTVKQKFM